MNPTPIYDQLRGERLNADIPDTGADPHHVTCPRRHDLLASGPYPAPVFARPPGPRTDRAAGQHPTVRATPPRQPAGDGQ
ncbi:MAG: hypothetical protein ABIZ05_13325 [Pseudonocardiaceae bacterium]